MDDLAPMQPARVAARLWCVALGLGALLLGSAPLVGLRPGGLTAASPSFVLGAIALVAALARVSYRQRALALVVLGALAAVLGLNGSGPAAGIGVGGFAWGLLRLVGAVGLSAALVFRGRYRAFRGARFLLGAGFVTALPFMVHAALLLVGAHGFGPEQVGAGLALAAVIAALTGFMGSETTGAAPYTAFGVIVTLSLELGLEALAGTPWLGPDGFPHVLAASLATAAFAGTTAVIALGCFQILAGRFAADARRINLHAPVREKTKLERTGDWPTQG
jgi:hypothetical protein